jgi:hypothetical protein
MALFNFRLFLRPTPIGKAIIERLTAEGTDRQADARRWVELGYALEQAGFRLDGTTVYHAGRVFAADQVQAGAAPAAPVASDSSLAASAPAEPAPSSDRPRHTAAPTSQVAEHAAAQPSKVPAPQPSVPPAPRPTTSSQRPDDELTSNLRDLSL